MKTHLTKQRRNSHFTPNWNQDLPNIIPTIKKSQSLLKFTGVQNFKLIQQGYLTPNILKIKFMCKNHANAKSTHFYETTEGQKIYYCSACSNEITKQGFSVKNLNQIKNFNKNQSEKKFEPKKFDFMKKKSVTEEDLKFEVLKHAQEGISQLERKANLYIIQIDEYGKMLLGQLNHNFNEVIRFLHNQKQNCIQLIFDKIDQLKSPLHELKNNICNQKWELENIKSRLRLLHTQQSINQMTKSLATISNNEYTKIEKIIERKDEIKKILESKVEMNKKDCFQSLGSVQEIIETVYNNFFIKSQNKNILSDLSPNLITKEICQETVSEFLSPIRTKDPREPKSNHTLKQEIENIQNTINKEEKSRFHGYLSLNEKAEKINPFAISIKQYSNQMIKKRSSEITTISSLTSLMP